MADSYITVPNSQNVDTATFSINGVTVNRQRTILGDPNSAANFLSVNVNGAILAQSVDQDMQWETVLQLRRIALLLEVMLGRTVSLNDVTKVT